MAYKLAIASGKGGTGKTTVSVNLFHYLNELYEGQVQLVDCDVEEPNDLIFFSDSKLISEKQISQLVPIIDNKKCTYCRKCAEYCEFNAIIVIPPAEFAEVNASLCHSCGACSVACQDNAISEQPKIIGTVTEYETSNETKLVEGRLEIGSTMQTMLIKELKKSIVANTDIILYDAPPGTSCPVVETVSDTDYVILVAEPTPFGLHDLKLMVELLKEIHIPFGVIINKAGLGDNKIYEYLLIEGIEIMGEIPFSESFAASYAVGNVWNNIQQEISDAYREIVKAMNHRILQNEGDNYFKW